MAGLRVLLLDAVAPDSSIIIFTLPELASQWATRVGFSCIMCVHLLAHDDAYVTGTFLLNDCLLAHFFHELARTTIP
jgi:hypothetical protein